MRTSLIVIAGLTMTLVASLDPSARAQAPAAAPPPAPAASPAPAAGQNPPGVNPTHYQCYRVSETEPFRPREVKLRDQFGASATKVVKTVLLCAPVDKNNLPAKDKQTHYVCYEEEGKAVDKKVTVANQFGRQGLVVHAPSLLCVPSLKKLQ